MILHNGRSEQDPILSIPIRREPIDVNSSPTQHTSPRSATLATAALVAAICTAAVWAIGPQGNFPLSDDWSYAWATRSLCQGEGLDLLPWTGASLLFQAWYGALACKVAGFSFETLRATTLVVALLGVMTGYASLVSGRAGAVAAAFGALAVAFNPLYTNLAFTFMTDVPAAAIGLVAAACYTRSDRGERLAWVIAGSILCSAAALIRQPLALVGLAAALAFLTTSPSPIAGRIRNAAIAVTPPFAALFAWWLLIASPSDAPAAVSNKVNEALALTWLMLANIGFKALLTTGLLSLPIAAALPLAENGHHRRWLIACTFFLGGVATFLWFHEGSLMFYLPNVLYDFGVGARTTRDVAFLALGEPFSLGSTFRIALTALAVGSTAHLLVAVGIRARELLTGKAAIFSWAAILIAGAALLQSVYFFDRYLLACLLPLNCALLLSRNVRIGPVAMGALAALALFGTAGTHDHMEWNRARFSLVEQLKAQGFGPRQIDAGMDLNGWELAAELDTWPSDQQARPGQRSSLKSWWWVDDDEWVLAFRELDGYRSIYQQPFTKWLPPSQGMIHALQRSE
jgi:hypothetical protein